MIKNSSNLYEKQYNMLIKYADKNIFTIVRKVCFNIISTEY